MQPPHEVPTLVDDAGPGTLVLRGHRESDVQGSFEQCQDPLSQAWTTVPIPYTRDDAKRFVREAMPAGWQLDREWAFAVEYDGGYGGTVSLRNEGDGRAEIAYGSHPRIRGTGAMERALRLLLDWGFAAPPHGRGLHTVIWWANRGNWASRKLAWRLGFDIAPRAVRHWLPQRGELLDAWVGTLLAGDARLPRTAWREAARVESPRLPIRLRAPKPEDAERVLEGCRDPETRHWLSRIPEDYSLADAHDAVLRWQEQMAVGDAVHCIVADAGDDRLLGTVSLFDIDDLGAEIGYWTHPAERRRGVMSEAVRLLVRHGLVPAEDGGLGLPKLCAHAGTDNVGSRGVLQHAGLTASNPVRLGTRTRAGLADAVRYEVLAGELAAE